MDEAQIKVWNYIFSIDCVSSPVNDM